MSLSHDAVAAATPRKSHTNDSSTYPPIAQRTLPLQEQDHNSFRFLVTTSPAQLKDKAEMRENRKHVMRDYLRKERCKTPGTRDIRADGAMEVGKRRMLDTIPKTTVSSSKLTAPNHIFGPGSLVPQSRSTRSEEQVDTVGSLQQSFDEGRLSSDEGVSSKRRQQTSGTSGIISPELHEMNG